MWMILEGIDGAGKTTTAKRILEVHDQFEYGHVGPPGIADPVLVDGEWSQLARTWYLDDRPHVIWDRGHLGELVYGVDRGFGGNRELVAAERGWLRLLEAILMNRRTSVIWLARDPKLAHEAQMNTPPRTLTELHVHHYRYADLVDGDLLKLRVATVEGEGGPEHIVKQLPAALEMIERRPVLHRDHEGVGSVAPQVWVLGEQRSPAAWSPAPLATYSGTELVWPVVDPVKMRVSNVARPDWFLQDVRRSPWAPRWRDDLYRRWASLGEPAVVTLGRTAERACQESDVTVYAALDHPQYVRRFYHGSQASYREELAAVLRGARGDTGVPMAVDVRFLEWGKVLSDA